MPLACKQFSLHVWIIRLFGSRGARTDVHCRPRVALLMKLDRQGKLRLFKGLISGSAFECLLLYHQSCAGITAEIIASIRNPDFEMVTLRDFKP